MATAEDIQRAMVEGFTFKGWTPDIPEYMPDADLEFFAVFEPITYTAKFIADGAEIGSVEYDLSMDKLDEPAVPEKECLIDIRIDARLDNGLRLLLIHRLAIYSNILELLT